MSAATRASRAKPIGDPRRGAHGPAPRPVLERLAERSERQGDCLVYTGACDGEGYGIFWVNGRKTRSHRAAYEARHGVNLRRDQFLLHTCDNPPCFEESHLYIGDQLQNMRDRNARGVWPGGYPRATHCSHGHEYTEENVRLDAAGHRVCRECKREGASRHAVQ